MDSKKLVPFLEECLRLLWHLFALFVAVTYVKNSRAQANETHNSLQALRYLKRGCPIARNNWS